MTGTPPEVTRVVRTSMLALGCVAALLPGLAFAAAPAARKPVAQQRLPLDQRQIAALVGNLGDKSYAVRESATRTLTAAGVAAKAELLKALRSPDAEVRYRARLVLAEVLEVDWRKRLEAFVDDAQGERQHDLPGWKRYRALLGDSRSARRLFADMQRNEPGLLEAGDVGPQHVGAVFDGRCQQVQEGMRVPGRSVERQVPVGTVAALLFVASDEAVPITPQSAMYVTNFCYQQPFQQAIAGSDRMPLLKKLLGLWVKRNFSSDSSTTYQSMMLALRFNLKEGVEPAVAMLKDGASPPHMRQYAILVVGKFGTRADVATLEPLLSDASVCAQQQSAKSTVVETQIRDVALAIMIHLSGQKLSDFGFARAQPNAMVLYNTATLGFASQQQREAALAKWKEWWARSAGKS